MSGPPLAGTVVVSIGHTLPGLCCLAILRDFGAEVVRVERARASGDGGPYAALQGSFPNRSFTAGTSAVHLDLKNPTGREAFHRLAGEADVVLDGFRPGVAARLGIDHETLRRDHPELVVASISGYGQEGPLSQKAGHDVNYLADSGVLGCANPAALQGTTFADGLAGLGAAMNLVAALHEAARSGEGQYLDLAIVDAPLFLMATEFEYYRATGESRGGGGTHLTGRHPWYDVHATADGGAVALGAVEPAFHTALCEAIGHPELVERQYPDDASEREDTKEKFRAVFSARTRDDAMALFDDVDTCASPVLTTAEVAASPLMERVSRADDGEPDLIRSPVRTRGVRLPEASGESDVWKRFGFSPDEIEALASRRASGDER